MRYFDEPVGRVKIQTTSKNIQRYYTPKRLIRDLLSNDFFSQNSDFAKVLNFTRPGGMRRVQISCDICTRFARYLYSTKQTWIINNGNRTEWSPIWSVIIRVINKIGRPRSGSPIC